MNPGPTRRILVLVVSLGVFLALTATALAADPTDRSFGTEGIAEIEARVAEIEARIPRTGQVGGIADLEPTKGGKMLAAVYPMAEGGHYFAAARILPDGRLDTSFGEGGFTPPFRHGARKEVKGGGVLQAEGVVGQTDGKVILAGYRERANGTYAPALARFTRRGTPDRGFGDRGKVFPLPTFGGKAIDHEGGGARLHDVAVEPDGTIVAVGDVVPEPYVEGELGPPRPSAIAIAYRPDGQVDRDFGHDGHLTITPHVKLTATGHFGYAYTGFSEVKALPSGKLLVSGFLRQQPVLYRLTADGRIDRGFGEDGRVLLGSPPKNGLESRGTYLRAPFALDRHGRIVLCGPLNPGKADGLEEPLAFLRLLPDGRRDPSFGRSIHMERDTQERASSPRPHAVQALQFEPQAIAIDGQGRIVVTGGELALYTRGQKEPGHEDFTSRRFLPNGRSDRSFGEGGVWWTDPPGSQSLGRAAVTQPDGRVVAGGWVQIERFAGNGPGNTAMLLTRYR